MRETPRTPVNSAHLNDTEPREAAPRATPAGQQDSEQALVQADLLVEDVSIDGMCGVY